MKTLTTETMMAARFFDNDVNKVPKTSITVGVGTILDAKKYYLVNGAVKHVHSSCVGNNIYGHQPLQLHPRHIVCDYDACAELRVGTYKYFLDIEKDHLDPNSLL